MLGHTGRAPTDVQACCPGRLGRPGGSVDVLRIGKSVEIRPLGGASGCLAMILVSVVLSILLTVVLNLLLR